MLNLYNIHQKLHKMSDELREFDADVLAYYEGSKAPDLETIRQHIIGRMVMLANKKKAGLSSSEENQELNKLHELSGYFDPNKYPQSKADLAEKELKEFKGEK